MLKRFFDAIEKQLDDIGILVVSVVVLLDTMDFEPTAIYAIAVIFFAVLMIAVLALTQKRKRIFHGMLINLIILVACKVLAVAVISLLK